MKSQPWVTKAPAFWPCWGVVTVLETEGARELWCGCIFSHKSFQKILKYPVTTDSPKKKSGSHDSKMLWKERSKRCIVSIWGSCNNLVLKNDVEEHWLHEWVTPKLCSCSSQDQQGACRINCVTAAKAGTFPWLRVLHGQRLTTPTKFSPWWMSAARVPLKLNPFPSSFSCYGTFFLLCARGVFVG